VSAEQIQHKKKLIVR